MPRFFPFPHLSFLIMVAASMPHSAVAQMPSSPDDVTIENHLGAAVWRPQSIKNDPHRSTTFLFAEQLELGNATFIFSKGTCSKNVFLFAKRLVLTGNSFFDLVSRNPDQPEGGNLVIVADAIEVRSNSSCTAMLRGWNGRDFEGKPPPSGPGVATPWNPKTNGLPGGNGGVLVIACPSFIGDDAWESRSNQITWFPADLSYPSPKFSAFNGNIVCLMGKGAFRCYNPGGFGGLFWNSGFDFNHAFAPDGVDGRNLWFDILDDSAPYLPDWTFGLEMVIQFESLLSEMSGDVQRDDEAQLVQDFLRYKAIRSSVLPESLASRVATARQAIEDIRKIRLKSVWSDTLTIQTIAGARLLPRFVEKGNLENRLAPSDALVRPRVVNGHRMLGIVTRNPQSPDRVQFTFDADLTLDPALVLLASAQLQPLGQSVVGSFANWKLSIPKDSVEGVLDFSAQVSANVLQCTLTLDPASAALTLWHLNDEAGLGFPLQYECMADKDVRGEIRLAISFSRQSHPEVSVNAGSIKSNSKTPVKISYFIADNQVVPLMPEMDLAPGAEKAISLSASMPTNPVKLSVPDQAVTYFRDVGTLDGFDVTDVGGLIESVDVKNLLEFDDARGGGLIEADLTVLMDEDTIGGVITSKEGPYHLSSRGSDGSEKKAVFIRQRSGPRRFYIEGVAYYQHDSRFNFKSEPSDSSVIKLEEKLLPPP